MESDRLYIGETHTLLDDKGRLSVPMHFRAIMKVHDHDTWFLTRGFDRAIFLFQKAEWLSLLAQQDGAPLLDPELLDFRRMFIGGAAKVKRDRQSRLMIPNHLREYAGITKEAVLIGLADHLELWSKAGWEAFQQAQVEAYKKQAGELFGSRRSAPATTKGVAQGDND